MKVRTGIKWVAAIMLMVVLCFSVTVAAVSYTHLESNHIAGVLGKQC